MIQKIFDRAAVLFAFEQVGGAQVALDEAKKYSVDLEICGLGGLRMKKEGVKILQDTTSISAIGIWEALPLIVPTLKIQKNF